MAIIIPRKTWQASERLELLVNEYPTRHKMERGAAHWSGGNKYKPNWLDKESYDFLIDGYKNIYRNDRPIHHTKAHTWRMNTRNIGISLAGMAGSGINTNTWQRYMFDDSKFYHMVSEEQFEIMAWLFAFCSIWFYIPVDNIMTHSEYAKLRNTYPGYPNGYWPERWDLDGLGDSLRGKIRYYKVGINEILKEMGAI